MHRLLFEIATKMKLGDIKAAVIKSTVFKENNGALATLKVVKLTPRNKHIRVKYLFFKHHCGK